MMRTEKQRRGATMVMLVILLPILFILSAMAINLAYIQVVNTKVQVVTDVAARAASAGYVESGDEADGLAAAQLMASMNPIDSMVLPIDATDLEFGTSERGAANEAYTFTPGTDGNAVRLRTDSYAGGSGTALQTFFPIGGSLMEIRPLCSATHTQMTLDVAVIVDRSGSMSFAADQKSGGGVPPGAPAGWGYGDPVPSFSRWLDLVDAVNAFCDELTQSTKVERVALVSYSNDVTIDHVLTDEYGGILAALDGITQSFHGGRTNVGGGVLDGLTAVEDATHGRPSAAKALVLMSDGNHNTGTDPLVATADAVAAGVPIYTVSFSNEADQDLMQQIADMTGGAHYHAVDATELNQAFRDIARRLPSMLTQ